MDSVKTFLVRLCEMLGDYVSLDVVNSKFDEFFYKDGTTEIQDKVFHIILGIVS